jgi:GTP diphosphokinase / guanosine-3',5'-bis(diphosphate) 3'-diphosphatase
VEIGTKYTIEPSEDWLKCVMTYRAKIYLNRMLKNRMKSEFIRCPQCGTLPDDEVIGFKNADGTISVHKRYCPHAICRA